MSYKLACARSPYQWVTSCQLDDVMSRIGCAQQAEGKQLPFLMQLKALPAAGASR
jgi:hypothetical protein